MEESGSPSRPSPGPSQAVYTDIDGTVTAYNTIFEFLRFDAADRSCAGEAEEFLAGLRSAASNGVPRSVTNARYFGWWRGRSVAEVKELGERWADLQAESPDTWPFLEPVASLLDAHAMSGRRIVAVTASFAPALVRVRRRWPQLELLCTAPRSAHGLYTGDIEEALVGDAKARAVAAHAAAHAVDLAASFAYGDHHSDLQFMALTGESLLVTPEPVTPEPVTPEPVTPGTLNAPAPVG
ncbi:HAD family phosphatase [Arthrobacter sp. CJ23]|uniref:HAD family hydrolase n=1 Tax=Arthrobacter sp. CJ23 TaxID=2972479 RepID=UPI00215CDFE4|nr:haloacid dehalogenase-like hydrolase [Arthrobacter sp. CJ23]UVJ39022.1 haloacid dehalogenase-like hydrolase [Arthrobacter sp. CJ23]